ncbi:proteasome component M29 [Kickxella alabastrina]|nr:proteasome component M29 [Kickxella alabastrina]
MTDAADIELLDTLAMRFALATSSEQVQKLITTLLVPLLDKLDSASAAVKAKIIGLLGQINRKLKSNPEVKLPIEALAESTLTKTATGYSQSFKLMYVPMAVERADEDQLVSILPRILDGTRGRPMSQLVVLVTALFTALQKVIKLTDCQIKGLGFGNSFPHRGEIFLKYAADLFMLNPVQPGVQTANIPVAMGLSSSAQLTITNEGKAPWVSNAKLLEEIKLSVLHIVSSELAFPNDVADGVHEHRLLALLYASCDPFFPQVASQGKDSLKRLRPVDVDSKTFVDAAFSMFLGSGNDKSRRSPVAVAVRLRLFSFLSKSATAVAMFPQCAQVISQTLFGTGTGTTNNLRRQGMAFLQWVVRTAPQPKLDDVANGLMQMIRQLLVSDDAESGLGGSFNDDVVRGSAFVAWGTLTRRVPSLVTADLEGLQALFGAFSVEPPSIHISIQEALLAMLPAYEFGKLSKETEDTLLAFLQVQLKSTIHQARYCALRYAIAAFPFANMEARWLCLLALADSKPEIQSLAHSGLAITLDAKSAPEMRTANLPQLAGAIRFLHKRVAEALQLSSDQQSAARARANAINPLIYSGIVDFGRLLILATGLLQLSGAQDCEGDFASMFVAFSMTLADVQPLSLQPLRKGMRAALRSMDADIDTVVAGAVSTSVSSAWMEIVVVALTVSRVFESGALSRSLMCLVELLSLGQPSASLALFDKRQMLLPLMEARDFTVQQSAVRALATVFATKLWADGQPGGQLERAFWNDQVALFMAELLATANEPEHPKLIDKIQGATLALGYIAYGLDVARTALRQSWAGLGLSGLGVVIENTRLTLLQKIQLASKASIFPITTVSQCMAVGTLGMSALADDLQQNQLSATDGEAVMAAMVNLAKIATTTKQQDAVFDGLAQIVLGSPQLAASLIESMQALARSVNKKKLDLHFKMGRALALSLGRFKCSLMELEWIFPIDPAAVYNKKQLNANSDALETLLELIADRLAVSTNLQDRQAAVVWALSLVQLCPSMAQLKPWLPRLHACVCALLTDRDEFVRELASNALALIYEMGDVFSKEDMMVSLKMLFGSNNDKPADATGLSVERQATGQQRAAEGRTANPTFKCILSLAMDMRNPSLFYPLIQLASQAPSLGGSGSGSTTSGRYGHSYGLSANIERACAAVQPHIRPVIPKLFRSTFDPNPQTQTAMKGIWHTLLKFKAFAKTAPAGSQDINDSDSDAGMMELFWDVIIEECLSSMGQFEWQVRESGCNALASALYGVNPDRIVPYLERIWQMSFRALDDIKATVRESGLKACQALANSTVSWCTPRIPPNEKHAQHAQSVLAIVMPFLIDKGIVSDAEDVRQFGTGLALKLCRTSGAYLSPFVPAIAERMLESLSNMEPQAANYLTFHANEHNMSPEQLESLRLSAVKASPIMQGIELALDQLNPQGMAELVPRLQNIIRHGIGMATRAGCARTVAILCVKQLELVEPHSGALVKAISGSLTESSAMQRQAWASSIGYMAGMLTPGMLRNLLRHLEKTYFGKYESDVRDVSGQVLQQLARNCPEKLRQHAGEAGAMSFILFGCRDSDEHIAEAFQSAWQECVLGLGTAVVGGHLTELLNLPLKHLADDRWHCRIQSAKTIVDVTRMLERTSRAAASASISASNIDGGVALPNDALSTLAQMTLPELIKTSQGSMWPGKEHVLECLVRVCAANSRLFGDMVADNDGTNVTGVDSDTPLVVYAILLKQLDVGTAAYQRAAVGHYNSLVTALSPSDIYSMVSDVLLKTVRQSVSAATAPDADGDEPMQQPQQLMLIAAATKALLLSLPTTRVLTANESGCLSAALKENARTGVWNIRVASLEGLAALSKHCARNWNTLCAMDVGVVLGAVRACATEGKYLAVRTAALDSLEALFSALREAPGDAAAWRAEARAILELLLLDSAPSIADRAKDLGPQWTTA